MLRGFVSIKLNFEFRIFLYFLTKEATSSAVTGFAPKIINRSTTFLSSLMFPVQLKF